MKDTSVASVGTGTGYNQIVAYNLPTIYLWPRSKVSCYAPDDRSSLLDVLPGYAGAPADAPIRDIELRFYVDIARQIDGIWKAERKLTLEALDENSFPISGLAVEWSRESGSDELMFVNAAGDEVESLEGNDAVSTDDDGLAEVIIRHPSMSVDAADREVVIVASSPEDDATIRLTLTRNDDVTSLDAIARKGETTADGIWVYQPDAAERTARNDGLVDLQERLNEVVSRHQGVPANTWHFIPLEGVFDETTRDAVRLYRAYFVGVRRPAYPYDLRHIGPSDELKSYLMAEYGFDLDAQDQTGWVVDRRLLIGDEWDLTPDAIDGLLELYEGVVERLKTEMVRVADTYLNESTFWLHRPTHQPYQASADYVFRVTQNNVQVMAQPTGNAPLLDSSNNAVVVNAGDLYPSPQTPSSGRVQIVTDAGPGWVDPAYGRLNTDDQSDPQNCGNHGGNGVAYSFGCKWRPNEYATDLSTNPHAPPADVQGTAQRRIAHWDEYEDGHRPGKTSADGGWQVAPSYTGCDCSGFVQSCITDAMLDGGNTRVVPAAILLSITHNNNRYPSNEIAASAFSGVGRQVPTPVVDTARQWMRRGDVLSSATHVVFVEPDRPVIVTAMTTSGPAVSQGGQTFDVYNEYGDFQYYRTNGTQAPTDPTRFIRKAILMPFHYWGRHLDDVNIGKLYIWT